jgi:hypothetical protein
VARVLGGFEEFDGLEGRVVWLLIHRVSERSVRVLQLLGMVDADVGESTGWLSRS